MAGLPLARAGGGWPAWVGWGAGVVAVYAALFGVGLLLLGPRWEGAALLVVAAVAFGVVARATGALEAERPREGE